MLELIKSVLRGHKKSRTESNRKSVTGISDSEWHLKYAASCEEKWLLKYGASYGDIVAYDESIANYIARNDVPKYAVEWLAESIKGGGNVERSAIWDSVEKKLPYLCETEEELWYFECEEDPLKNSSEGIYSLLLAYKYGKIKNENKLSFWINRLLFLASTGDYMAQGLLCWRCGLIMQDETYDGVLPQNMWEELKQTYEGRILSSCDAGEPYAQLAVAKYGQNTDDQKIVMLYTSAIEKGLTDACYYYARHLVLHRHVANGMMTSIPPYGTSEWQNYMKEELSLYKKGAEFNNGVMAGYCQYRLADMYKDGDGGVLKDAAMAQIWFKKSFENGYSRAQYHIDL